MNSLTKDQLESLLIVANYEDEASIPIESRKTTLNNGRVEKAPLLTWDELSSIASDYADYALFCSRLDKIDNLDDPIRRAAFASQHMMISSHPNGLLKSLGFDDRPLTITEGHAWDIMQPGEWEGGNHGDHGVAPTTLKQLPWLLERPALLANDPSDTSKVLAVLPATDGRGYPLITPLLADAHGQFDVQKFISNMVLTLFGPDNFNSYFGNCLKRDAIIYIDSLQENRLGKMVGAMPFELLSELPRDKRLAECQVPTRDKREAPNQLAGPWLRENVVKLLEKGRGNVDLTPLPVPDSSEER